MRPSWSSSTLKIAWLSPYSAGGADGERLAQQSHQAHALFAAAIFHIEHALGGCFLRQHREPADGLEFRETGAVLKRIEAGRFRPTTSFELSHAIVSAMTRHQEGFLGIRALLERPLAEAREAGLEADARRQCLRVIESSYEEHGGFRLRTLKSA
jgi:hypothetical protein